jgi:hypothetical protein
MAANRPLTIEDYADDLKGFGPLYRSFARARFAEFKAAGLTGEALQMAVDAVDNARQAPGTGPFWRLLEDVRRHHLNNRGE